MGACSKEACTLHRDRPVRCSRQAGGGRLAGQTIVAMQAQQVPSKKTSCLRRHCILRCAEIPSSSDAANTRCSPAGTSSQSCCAAAALITNIIAGPPRGFTVHTFASSLLVRLSLLLIVGIAIHPILCAEGRHLQQLNACYTELEPSAALLLHWTKVPAVFTPM